MGYIYKVAVPHERWPSARQLDAALVAANDPVRLLVKPFTSKAPFEICAAERLGLEVGGEPHVVDAREYLFDPDNDTFELRDIMTDCGMDTAPLAGAHIFSITAHGDGRDWIAVRALVTRLVTDFGGYGIDFQSGLAGCGDWVDAFGDRLGHQQEACHKMVAQAVADNAAKSA
ncbi:MAG: hypothetical protein CL955_02200 [Erythrobacteraceae bacterium]|nr:hypothetical protein [Erythrobacteraceae bacterium]